MIFSRCPFQSSFLSSLPSFLVFVFLCLFLFSLFCWYQRSILSLLFSCVFFSSLLFIFVLLLLLLSLILVCLFSRGQAYGTTRFVFWYYLFKNLSFQTLFYYFIFFLIHGDWLASWRTKMVFIFLIYFFGHFCLYLL